MKYVLFSWIALLFMLSISISGRASFAYNNNYAESKQQVAVTKQEKKPCGDVMQSSSQYSIFHYDNGDDYVSDGLYRIFDEKGQIGFASEQGDTVIVPQFAFAFPFEDGKARATCIGKKEIAGEYYVWESNEWFYIDKTGAKISDVFDDPFKIE